MAKSVITTNRSHDRPDDGGQRAPRARLRAAARRSVVRWRLLRRAHDRVAYLLDPRIDRFVLEHAVFPAILNAPDLQRVLFVGCDWYTKDYPTKFHGRVFRTIDVDPTKARYGAADHIVGSVADLDLHVAEGCLDAIVLNGVIGFGLQDRDDAERAISGCFRALRGEGWLIIGWNDVDDLRPFHLHQLEALSSFEARPLPPFPSYRYPTFSPAKHTFDFYRRPPSSS